MNFYKHHIGDYASATEHLSWDEDQAYTRLLRVYYRDERPLPLDFAKVLRLARAQSRGQKEAVQTVLEEFFTKSDDGWRNKRADAEIAQAVKQAETNRRIAEQREFAKGSRTVNESLHEPSTNRSPEYMVGREPIQTPDSRLHYPVGTEGHSPPQPPKPKSKAGKRLPAGFPLDLLFALSEIPDLDVGEEAKKFADYEFKTPHSDWDATWRNWVRKAKQDGKYARKTTKPEIVWSRTS